MSAWTATSRPPRSPGAKAQDGTRPSRDDGSGDVGDIMSAASPAHGRIRQQPIRRQELVEALQRWVARDGDAGAAEAVAVAERVPPG